MQPRGLIGLGYDSMDHCGPEIAEVCFPFPNFRQSSDLQALRAYTNVGNYGILIHCTQGKDRTGLIIALILFLLDVPIHAISNDYIASEAELLPEKESRMKEIKSIGLTEDFAGCPKDWIEKMDKHLNEKYCGIEKYCEGIGFGKEEQENLRQLLRA
jgi:protein tyrosine/serine phosphatase